ncbi:MAG TPA: Nramp family divalent metal transporter [Conexibacter sp.]|nr:Nramp family divalent metal transporter [Conexibacter sp.]
MKDPRRNVRHHPVGRTPHLRAHHWRRRTLRQRRTGLLALIAVLGPGLLAGLSDDDPAGITTYSILGADYGYELLWVLALSTAALIVFHELAARTGVITGKGLILLVRERYGPAPAAFAVTALVVANVGTICAEFAGVAVGAELLAGVGRGVSVPLAAIVVIALVLGSSFHRVEHVLLALASVFVAYVAAGILADPDWGAAAQGLVVPRMPGGRDAVLVAVATLGTTLAPWGLAFMQSYAVDKRLRAEDLAYERVDVISGALLTGIIGAFIVIACAATLHPAGISIDDGAEAARALEPLAGSLASTLFALGFLGAALLAAAIVPLSTAYSVCEAAQHPAGLDARPRAAPLFYGTFVGAIAVAAAIVLIPGVPLIPVLFLTQALNAVLLLAILPFMRALARDPAVMGRYRLSRIDAVVTAVAIVAIAAACVVLLVLTVTA